MARKRKTRQENQYNVYMKKPDYKCLNKAIKIIEEITNDMETEQMIGYSSKEDVWMCYMTLKSILEKYDEVYR